ncbi:hypothetical protein [Actinomadura sp. 7K507]|uniref:hypothetical protein n=1 Tax=Actinomadura sp. 7K507 TaxID=2530365 RepID=UPI00104CC4E9|nr:hypothetical protein [Actinomadura sp. 7K507]TDC85134.1 hypothetical protein E1285_25630 [Actinomadura sp. 7K507]
MQGPSDSMDNPEPGESGQIDKADSPNVDDSTPDSDSDSTAASTVLAEVLPGVVFAFGELPEKLKLDLKLDPIDFGLLSATDREKISTFLASTGNAANVGGNLANAFASVEGVYRVTDATQAILNAGGTLAVKNGANIGAVFLNGKIVHQARFIPFTKVSTAQKLANIGSALAMVALQLQLSEVAGLVRTNIALTSQVLTTMYREQWSTLTGLVKAVDTAFGEAQEIESVTPNVWETVATKRADLLKARDQYRQNVGGHVREIKRLGARGRREYLEMNAEAIVFDAYALRSSLEAWTKYQVIRAAKVSATGREDEAGLVEVIERDTRSERDSALTEMRRLVYSLRRELRIIAELPGRATMPLTRSRRDSKTARLTCAQLLDAIEPLADALHPPVPPLEAPDIICAPASLDRKPYLRTLRWILEDGETLRVLSFPDQLEVLGSFGAASGGTKEKVVAAKDKAATTKEKVTAAIDKAAKNLVAVTDRRIITAKTSAFRKHGQIGQDIPMDQVRYVRAPAQDGSGRSAIDIITPEENIRLIFQADIDNAQVDALAAVLAESMIIPDAERDELQQRRQAALEAGKKGESITGPTSSGPVTDDVD